MSANARLYNEEGSQVCVDALQLEKEALALLESVAPNGEVPLPAAASAKKGRLSSGQPSKKRAKLSRADEDDEEMNSSSSSGSDDDSGSGSESDDGDSDAQNKKSKGKKADKKTPVKLSLKLNLGSASSSRSGSPANPRGRPPVRRQNLPL